MSNGISKIIKNRKQKEDQYLQGYQSYIDEYFRNKKFHFNKITLGIRLSIGV